ncbi:DegT/DnrJ/EryC1/StrS family aminotransferase [Candidatus Pacearchaeota archaeon]|nr:DegT/DnrJ/EryC1/StrS family aminotransferase [Candidatus Pacearchaeota archaeon]
MIPIGNLRRKYLVRKNEFDSAILRVLDSGWFILGKEVEEFEKEFAAYCGKNYGIGVGSGFDALLLALKALEIGDGDEIITVPHTAIPTVAAIIASGAIPKFVDVGEDCLMDVNKIKEVITEKTKAIMPVHLYGQACDMEQILEIANQHNLFIIEDCAQAHGAEYKGKRVPISTLGCFSFYPSKNMGAFGDGGMIVTDSEAISTRLKMLRNYGQATRYHAKMQGYNTRLDELHATILRVQLKYLNEDNEIRKQIALRYNLLLKEIVTIPNVNQNKKHVYHLYVIKTDKRDRLKEKLNELGIGTEIHYPIPLHLQEAYKYLGYKNGDFAQTEKAAKEILSIPIYPELTDTEIETVAQKIKEVMQNMAGP